MMTVLIVAYPLCRVSIDACGGAEQIASLLDRGIVGAGHRSIVIACEGSRVRGQLVAVPAAPNALGEAAVSEARRRQAAAIAETLARETVDIVHMHGIDFASYLPPDDVPVLATLHGPPDWYAPEALRPARPNTWLNAVSLHQHERIGANPYLLPPIDNGILVDAFGDDYQKHDHALVLGRIAPEKGVHLAIEAARAAGIPLIVAGEVAAFPEHRRYFEEEVRPRLDSQRRYIGAAGLAVKRRLLGRSRCLLIASQVEETSSLSAREALAAGTPVIAFKRGALIETVDHGRTGFLVDDLAGMVAAIPRTHEIDGETCRREARQRFDAARMTQSYLGVYEQLSRKRESVTGGERRPL